MNRVDGREQITESAAYVQNTLTWRNKKGVITLEQPMIIPFAFAEAESGTAIVEDPAVCHWTVATAKAEGIPETMLRRRPIKMHWGSCPCGNSKMAIGYKQSESARIE